VRIQKTKTKKPKQNKSNEREKGREKVNDSHKKKQVGMLYLLFLFFSKEDPSHCATKWKNLN
jgi:hypothetical protein